MKKFLTFILISLGLFVSVSNVYAASLLFSPRSGTYNVGDTFSVDVYVSTTSNKEINAVSGKVFYPSSKLSMVSLSKSNSVIDLWTVNPTHNGNSINFEGVILKSAHNTAKGKIVGITFKVINSGLATLSFSQSSSVLANDGLGTNVLSVTGNAKYTLENPKPETEDSNVEVPVITSSSHPDSNVWYANNIAKLSWTLPADVIGVAYLVDQNENTNPEKKSYGLKDGVESGTLPDGISYAHVRFKRATGWGVPGHYRLEIDTTAPSALASNEQLGDDSPTKKLALSATDATSGILNFGVSIDGEKENFVSVVGEITNFTTNALLLGEHNILVKAYDKAGNYLASKNILKVNVLLPPTITEYSKILRDGDFLVIKGQSYPSIDVSFTLKRNIPSSVGFLGNVSYNADTTNLSGMAHSDSDGNFVFVYKDRVGYGLYDVNAKNVMKDGHESVSTSTINIEVKEWWIMHFLRIWWRTILLSLGLLIFIIFCYNIYIKYGKRRKENNREKAQN